MTVTIVNLLVATNGDQLATWFKPYVANSPMIASRSIITRARCHGNEARDLCVCVSVAKDTLSASKDS
jgi:hypothetical protein